MDRLTLARRLSITLAPTMLIQAVLGLALHSEYRDVRWIEATWWGNDAVTALVAVPLLIAALVLARRRSARGTLLWAGVLAYAVYDYAYYALGAALNRFLALYLACALLAAAALISLLSAIDVRSIAERLRHKTPRRTLGGYFMFVATGLTAIWLGTWAAYAFGGRPTPVEPEAFRLVAVLDLTLMVPVLALGGWWLWRRDPWGPIVSALAGVQASIYLLVLSVNSVVAIASGLAEAPGELVIWLPLFLATSAATVVVHLSVSGQIQPRTADA